MIRGAILTSVSTLSLAKVLKSTNVTTVLPVVVHSWAVLDYDWAALGTTYEEAIATNTFIPENNAMCGIKFYQGEAFVTVPRW